MKRNIVKYLLIILIGISMVTVTFSRNGRFMEGARKSVMMEMKNKNYQKSISMIDDILEKTPDDHELKYLKAICLIELNENLNEATDLLLSASANLDKNDVNYYLGVSYQRQYDFQNAIQAYNAYLVNLSKKEVGQTNITNTLKECLLAIESTKTGNMVHLKSKNQTDLKKLPGVINQSITGVVINKPNEFNTKGDEKYPGPSLMYMPGDAEKAEYLYFSAKVKKKPNHKNIFRVPQLINGTLGEPEDLGDIVNTHGDEISPYYNAENKVLYFASNGHEGMGGFDIYKSIYQEGTNSWSDPVNVDFPINSPYNDFLYIEDKNTGNVVFASDRETKPEEFTVYTLLLEENVRNRMYSGKQDLYLASVFFKEKPNEENARKNEVTNKPKHIAEKVSPGDALRLQLKADSVGLLIKLKNIELANAENEQKKSIIAMEIDRLKQKQQFIIDMANKKKAQAQSYSEQIKPAPVDTLPASDPTLADEGKTEKVPSLMTNKSKDAIPVSKFEIRAVSPYSEYMPFEPKPDKTNQVCYLIQLGVFSKKIDNEAFGGIYPIYFENLEGKNLTKYYAGEFVSLADARKALEQVKRLGNNDAFIVAEYNNESIDVNKAISMENDE